MQTSTQKRRIWPKIITFTFILLVAVVAVSLLPRGFSQDLSLIGQGSNVVILVHESNILQSGETMVAMNEVRDEYEDRVTFVIADIMTPAGKEFTDKHALHPAALVFFAANGEKLQTDYESQTGASLRKNLNIIFQY